jgi:hypothetical protein
MQNDAGERINSGTFLTREDMFRSCLGRSSQGGGPLRLGHGHTRLQFMPLPRSGGYRAGLSLSNRCRSGVRRDLPIPGSPESKNHLAFTVPGLGPPALQQGQFLLAAYEWRKRRGV